MKKIFIPFVICCVLISTCGQKFKMGTVTERRAFFLSMDSVGVLLEVNMDTSLVYVRDSSAAILQLVKLLADANQKYYESQGKLDTAVAYYLETKNNKPLLHW